MSTQRDNNDKRTYASGSAESSSSGHFAPVPSPQEDELPESFRVGGAAELAIAQAEKAKSSQTEYELCEAFRRDLQCMREEYKVPTPHFGPPPTTKEGRLWHALTVYENYSKANPVFRFALASYEKCEKSIASLWNAACKEYLQRPDTYDHLLGDFVPSLLRTRCRNHLEEQAYTEGTNATAAQDWRAYQRRLKRRQQQTYRLSTGFTELDRLTGGLPALAMLGGTTGVGKTSFALALAAGSLRAHPDLAVLFYSLDMSKDVVLDRLLCQQSGIEYREICHNYDDARVSSFLSEAEKELGTSVLPRLRILEREQLGGGMEEILSALNKHTRELTEASQAQQVLCVIDYFQLLDPGDSTLSSLAADAKRIELLQLALQMRRTHQSVSPDSFLVMSEVRKGESGRPRLALDDLMGSARISYSADCILLLEPDGEAVESAADTTPLLLTIAKGRDGMRRGTIRLTFEYGCNRFREAESPAQKAADQERTGSRAAGRVINPLAGGTAS